MSTVQAFVEKHPEGPSVRGFLHQPAVASGHAVVLSHGAGSNSRAPLLVAVSEALTEAGFAVLRCDLPFRQARPKGPPAGSAALDREGLRRAVLAVRRIAAGRVLLGGHSYGGRQASLLAASDPAVADGLLLLSYPLHPPQNPVQLRTAHLPQLRTPALFVHGSRDPFGSLEEMRAALALIPAATELAAIDGSAHDLPPQRAAETVGSYFGNPAGFKPGTIFSAFL